MLGTTTVYDFYKDNDDGVGGGGDNTMLMIIMIIHLHCHYSKQQAWEGQANGTHTAKQPVCERDDVTALWNKAVHTGREVMANRPGIIIKTRERKHAF